MLSRLQVRAKSVKLSLVTLKLKLTNPPPDLSFKSCPVTSALFPSLSFHLRKTGTHSLPEGTIPRPDMVPFPPTFPSKNHSAEGALPAAADSFSFPTSGTWGRGRGREKRAPERVPCEGPAVARAPPRARGVISESPGGDAHEAMGQECGGRPGRGCPHGHHGPREQELRAAGNEWGPAGGAVGQRGRRADGESGCNPRRPRSTEAAGTQAAAGPLRAAHLRDVMFLPPPAPHGPAARSGSAGHRHMERP